MSNSGVTPTPEPSPATVTMPLTTPPVKLTTGGKYNGKFNLRRNGNQDNKNNNKFIPKLAIIESLV